MEASRQGEGQFSPLYASPSSSSSSVGGVSALTDIRIPVDGMSSASSSEDGGAAAPARGNQQQQQEHLILPTAPPPTWAAATYRVKLSFESGEGGSQNPHWNESVSKKSMWPELCCAFQCPWYMVARVWSRTSLQTSVAPASLVCGLLFIASLPIYILEGWEEAPSQFRQAPPTWAFVLAFVAFLINTAVVIYLRRHIRQDRGIPGNTLDDASSVLCCPFTLCGCASCGPAVELAIMDRETNREHALGPPATAPRVIRERRKWTTNLWHCGCWSLTGALPEYMCAATCPAFMQLRVYYRVVENVSLCGAAGFLCGAWTVASITPVFLIILSLAIKSATLFLVGWVLFATEFLLFLPHIWLRTKVRERYSIPGTLTDDAFQAFCCPPCSLAQMERETDPALEVDSAAAEGERRVGVGHAKTSPYHDNVSSSPPFRQHTPAAAQAYEAGGGGGGGSQVHVEA